MSILRLKHHKSKFTTFSNDVFHAIQSPEAKLIWIYLLTKPDDWRIRQEDIKSQLGLGIDRYRRGMRELRDMHLLEDMYVKDDAGKFISHDLVLYDEPQELVSVHEEESDPHVWISSHEETPHLGKPALLLNTKKHTKYMNTTKEKREPTSQKKENKKKEIDWSSIEGLNLEAWDELMEYRRETRLPRYKTKRKAEELAQLPYEKQRECVRYTIDNEYKGLFPERYRAKASDDRTNWPSIEEMAKHGHDPEFQRKWGFIQ